MSVAANDMLLTSSGVPAGQFGIFFYGAGRVQLTFGNGFRCVGAGSIYRLPLGQSNGSGVQTFALDLNNLPNGGDIAAAELWNFQHWFRDPMGGGAKFNLSDGLAIQFCP
jgi:hypothetical protein